MYVGAHWMNITNMKIINDDDIWYQLLQTHLSALPHQCELHWQGRGGHGDWLGYHLDHLHIQQQGKARLTNPKETFIFHSLYGKEIWFLFGWCLTFYQDGIVRGNANRNSAADVLNKLTDVRILGHGECDSIFEDYEKRTRGKAKLRPSNVCGNSPTGDSCIGDSGSGLVTWNNDIQAYELIGVVSFGVGCNSSFFGKRTSHWGL